MWHISCGLRDFDRKASELRTDDRVWSTLVHSYFFREKCGVFGWQTDCDVSDIVILTTYIWWRFLDVGNRISMLVPEIAKTVTHILSLSSKHFVSNIDVTVNKFYCEWPKSSNYSGTALSETIGALLWLISYEFPETDIVRHIFQNI